MPHFAISSDPQRVHVRMIKDDDLYSSSWVLPHQLEDYNPETARSKLVRRVFKGLV